MLDLVGQLEGGWEVGGFRLILFMGLYAHSKKELSEEDKNSIQLEELTEWRVREEKRKCVENDKKRKEKF